MTEYKLRWCVRSVVGIVLALLVGAARAQSGDNNTAGVGIAFRPNDDGELVVAAIVPGGPADRVGLKPGGVLVAIDGQEVDGLRKRFGPG